MKITSTSPAPSLCSPKFRLCSSPHWWGPNASEWITSEERAGSLDFHLLLNQRWGRGTSADLCSAQVISTTQNQWLFSAPSRAAPCSPSSLMLLRSITAPLLEIPALNLQSLYTRSAATIKHCCFPRNHNSFSSCCQSSTDTLLQAPGHWT